MEAIKEIGVLQVNVSRFLNSRNVYMRGEYDGIRVSIAKVLREIGRAERDPESAALKLEEYKTELQDNDILANGTIDRLIRNDLVDSRMATSLINDSTIARDIALKLVEAAQLTIGQANLADQMAEYAVRLTEEERREALQPESFEAEHKK